MGTNIFKGVYERCNNHASANEWLIVQTYIFFHSFIIGNVHNFWFIDLNILNQLALKDDLQKYTCTVVVGIL